MQLQTILQQYKSPFIEKYGSLLTSSQRKAMHAIARCRTPGSGMLQVACAQCEHDQWRALSCGNRSCPLCQNYEASQWLDRQKQKLLPVDYFMVTFTVPYQLRGLVWNNQKEIYSLFFDCVTSTLNTFGSNSDELNAELGLTAVLHSHARNLDYHPHIHVIVPGGGINRKRKQWRKLKDQYLFNEFALARVFRARFIAAVKAAGFKIPETTPRQWVTNVRHVGKGLPALKYLTRYLYRGVISEKNIISNKDGKVTFKYTDSNKKTQTRTLSGEDFLNLILQHVLPKGFRRVRDYGFLHSNAKKLLRLVQLVLQVKLEAITPRRRPVFKCKHCQSPMVIKNILIGPRLNPD